MLDRGVRARRLRTEHPRRRHDSPDQNQWNDRIASLRTGATLAEAAAAIGVMAVVRRGSVRRVAGAMRTRVPLLRDRMALIGSLCRGQRHRGHGDICRNEYEREHAGKQPCRSRARGASQIDREAGTKRVHGREWYVGRVRSQSMRLAQRSSAR